MSGKQRKWVAHVHWKDGSVTEVEVSAGKGRRFEALTKVYKAVSIDGPNDPNLRGVVISCEGAKKEYTIGTPHSSNVVPIGTATRKGRFVRDKTKDRRFCVTIYITKLQKSPISHYLWTSNPMMALHAVMGMHRVTMEQVGDYKVEELFPDSATRIVLSKGTWTDSSGQVVQPAAASPTPIKTITKPADSKKQSVVYSQLTAEKRVVGPTYNVVKG